MKKQTCIEKIVSWISTHQNIIHHFILFLLSTSFILSDWMLGYFSISEFILVPLLFVLTLSVWKNISAKEWLSFFIVFILMGVHFAIHYSINPEFSWRIAGAAIVKVLFYTSFILITYRYIRKFRLEKNFLLWLNIIGAISLIIGLYIYVAILTESLPFEFFWHFTRTDVQSYYFRDTRHLVRMRSVFAEPAHFGFFLSTLLGVNLFSRIKFPPSLLFNFLWMVGIFLTFSLSSIVIMCMILVVFSLGFLIKNIRNLRLTHAFIAIGVLLCGAILLYFGWDFFEVAVIERMEQIRAGEDNSALERIFGSWQYINEELLWIGNGIGHTPIIWNNYAYFLSEMGIVALFISIIGSGILVVKNRGLGLLFIAMNFQRGGYLSPTFSLFLLVILVYAFQGEHSSNKKYLNGGKGTIK